MATQTKISLLGRPAIVKEFSGLRTITRIYDVQGDAITVANVETQCFIPFGTADNATDPAGEYPLALLTEQRVEQVAIQPSTFKVQLVRVFREFTPGTLVNVGNDVVTRDDSGRESVQSTSVCLASEAEALAPAIGDVISGKAVANVTIQKQGVGAQVIVTTISAGQLSETENTSNNGALSTITRVHFNEIPPTPAGYVLITEAVQNPEGVPTYSYTFAKGNGEVARDTQTSNNGALSTVRIRHLVAPMAANPIVSPGAGYALIDSGVQEADGHRVWSASFAKGEGEVGRETDTKLNGKLVIVTVRHLVAPMAANPIVSPGAGYSLVSESIQEQDGHRIWTSRYAKGLGEIRRTTDIGPVAGTTRVTVESLAATAAGAVVPTGVLIDQSDIEEDGYVRCIRTSVAGTITGTKATYKDIVEVTVPGTVWLTTQAISAGALSGTLAVANVTPPRRKSVAATVTIEIATTPPNTASVAYDLGSISCSVTSTSAEFSYHGFDYASTVDGTLTMTYPRRKANIRASIQVYPGCYLSGLTTVSGSFSYNSGAQYSRSSGGTVITETVMTSSETNTLTGTGSTAATDYATTGVLQRRSRPVFVAVDGTTYYEVVTWTV